MTYRVNEIFYSIQGEGHWTGRPSVFCRFADCNLWSGSEADRESAICTFCDTEFTDYTEYDHVDLVNAIDEQWPADNARKMVVFTGGEPALQITPSLVNNLTYRGFYTAIETNGTKRIIPDLDWVCVSPKTRRLHVSKGNELKLVYPQQKLTPDMFAHMKFDHFWLSPMDGPNVAENTQSALDYVLGHPQWRLNVQTHKVIGVR